MRMTQGLPNVYYANGAPIYVVNEEASRIESSFGMVAKYIGVQPPSDLNVSQYAYYTSTGLHPAITEVNHDTQQFNLVTYSGEEFTTRQNTLVVPLNPTATVTLSRPFQASSLSASRMFVGTNKGVFRDYVHSRVTNAGALYPYAVTASSSNFILAWRSNGENSIIHAYSENAAPEGGTGACITRFAAQGKDYLQASYEKLEDQTETRNLIVNAPISYSPGTVPSSRRLYESSYYSISPGSTGPTREYSIPSPTGSGKILILYIRSGSMSAYVYIEEADKLVNNMPCDVNNFLVLPSHSRTVLLDAYLDNWVTLSYTASWDAL